MIAMNQHTRRTASHAALLCALTLFATVVPASAPRAEENAGGPSAVKPPEAVQRLAPLAGRFEGTASYTADGKTTRFTLRQDSRLSAGGWGLECTESADTPELGHYASVNIFGFDPGRGQLHLYSVTNLGDCHDHVGNWLSDNQVYFREEGFLDGKPMIEEIPLTIVGPNQYRFRSVTTVAGQVTAIFEADMRRQDLAMGETSGRPAAMKH
jgi:hypothetical protein